MSPESNARNPYEPPAAVSLPETALRPVPKGSVTVRRIIYLHLAAFLLLASLGLEAKFVHLLPNFEHNLVIAAMVILGSLATSWVTPIVVLIVAMKSELTFGQRCAAVVLDCVISCSQILVLMPGFQ